MNRFSWLSRTRRKLGALARRDPLGFIWGCYWRLAVVLALGLALASLLGAPISLLWALAPIWVSAAFLLCWGFVVFLALALAMALYG